MPLDAVVFDAGGVLVRLDYEWIAQMLGELDVLVSSEQVRRAEIRGRLAYDAALTSGGGRLPAASTYFSGMLTAAGCPAGWIEEALRRMDARQRSDEFLWSKPNEGARQAIDALLATGLRLACVSNSDGRAEAHLERFGLRSGLEFVIDSHVVGIDKPDPRIFDLALEKLGVHPNRALYIGDLRSVDEHGSRSAGMHFVLIDPWGTYARGDTDCVTEIGRLPEHIERNFLTPSLRPRGG
jgi:putative hydrolase of the HAD superfamily